MQTIAEYLQILPNYTFPDRIIEKAAGMYGLSLSDEAFPSDPDTAFLMARDLAEAIMWDSAAGLVNGGGTKRTMGNRSFTDMSIQTSQHDRAAWQAKANALRLKWGIHETVYDVYDATELW